MGPINQGLGVCAHHLHPEPHFASFSKVYNVLSSEVRMPQISIISLLLSGLLMIASCGAPNYQVRQPLGYGVMPSEETWIAVDSAYQSPSRPNGVL